ncbi:redoxin domain-containing protein [Ornithinibacillus caprae]|uniref:redoxin domain-containing protein n=1 Tax=Ornithinibacillus caprae TaxID=2678566 RepID=UPI0012D95B70|nr:redoxin domain-containing protein [Ornithinibacillus caprae]
MCLIIILVKDVNVQPQTYDQTEANTEKAPNFHLTTLDGKEFKLSELEEKAVMINFWASWCGPCKDEMPAIQNVYDSYKDQEFEVLAINVGETEKAINRFLIENPSLEFPVLIEAQFVSDDYKVHYLPTSYFIRSDGTVDKHHIGELNEEQLHEYITNILPPDGVH